MEVFAGPFFFKNGEVKIISRGPSLKERSVSKVKICGVSKLEVCKFFLLLG